MTKCFFWFECISTSFRFFFFQAAFLSDYMIQKDNYQSDVPHLQCCFTTYVQAILKLIFLPLICIVKPPNSEHLRVLKNLSVIDRCPVLGENLTKIVTFETKRFPMHVSNAMCRIWDVYQI